jgi:hypothetical protein
MAIFTNYGTAQNKTAAATVVVTTTAIIPAGTLLVIGVCADNVAAATPAISSITAVGGGTWTDRAGATTQSGATTTAGTGVFVYCRTLYASTQVASGTAITVTFNASPAAKAVALWGAAGINGDVLRNTVVSAVSTTGVPSAVTAGTALAAGDVVIGVVGAENNAVPTGDADTLNGSWSTIDGVATTGGSANTNTTVAMQYKTVTATGAQTFNPTGGVADSVAIVFALAPQPVAATGTASMTLFAAANSVLVKTFYFHNTLTTATGTLPPAGVTQSGVTYNVSNGSVLNSTMDSLKGPGQVAAQIATVAQTAEQKNWIGRFVSPPLPAQTIPAGTWVVNDAIAESDLNSNLKLVFGALYVWRPSTGLKVGDIVVDIANANGSATPAFAATETPRSASAVGAAMTVQDGDLLVHEAWFDNIQALAASYTNTFFFDGGTTVSATDAASFLSAPTALFMPLPPPPPPRNIHLSNAALQPAFNR